MRSRPFSDKLVRMVARIKFPLIAALLCLCVTAPAAAQILLLNDWRGERHMNCLETVARDPSSGMALAEDWLRYGGDLAANHCLAVAETAIGDPGAAARAFAALAQRMPEDRWSDIGQLWAQSGHAWLLAEEPQQALQAFDRAVADLPNDVGVLADRAVVRALLGNYAGASADLTRAIGLGGANPELLLYRATAFRYLDQYNSALQDLNQALQMAPGFAEAYLERGNVRALSGDDSGAAADWRQVQTLAPNSELAARARQGLGQLSGQ
ncbi:MAG: hypothetical protein Kilf2KO_42300 [Rhodospirillales bacterium]